MFNDQSFDQLQRLSLANEGQAQEWPLAYLSITRY